MTARILTFALFVFSNSYHVTGQIYKTTCNYNHQTDTTIFTYNYKEINCSVKIPRKWNNYSTNGNTRDFLFTDTLKQTLTINFEQKNSFDFNKKNKLSDSSFVRSYVKHNLTWVKQSDSSYIKTLTAQPTQYIISKVFLRDLSVIMLHGIKNGVAIRFGIKQTSILSEKNCIEFLANLYGNLTEY